MQHQAARISQVVSVLVLLILFPWTAGAQSSPEDLDCDRLGAVTSRFLDESVVPGAAVAVLREGEPLCVITRGTANVELEAPVTRETVFELASLTKQMTSALIVTLTQEGLISLDDRLVTHVEESPQAWEPITIRQLLGHMGGLRHKFEPKFHDSYLVDYSTEVMLSAAAETPLVSEPGTDWEYSDQGYFLAGLAVERATGRDFAEVMREQFFTPLGMSRTRFLDQDAVIPGRASGYTVVDGEIRNNRRVWEFELTPHFGVMSTIDDMVRWERGLIEGTAISTEVTDQITRPYRVFYQEEDHTISYGMGWQIHEIDGRRIVQHAGYTGTYYLRDLTTGLSIIILTNRDSNAGPHPSILAMRLARLADPDFPAMDE